MPVGAYLDALASSDPTPGGGGVSALVGALAAALGCMVSEITLGKQSDTDKDALLTLKTLGVYVMLGWSKRDFIARLFSSQLMQLLVVVPLYVLGTYVILDGFSLNFKVFGYLCQSMIPTVGVVLISLGIATLSLVFTKPVDAILCRYPRCGFYVLAIVVYLLCLCTVFGGCLYIDQPMAMYVNTIRTRSAWSEYANWYVLQWISAAALLSRLLHLPFHWQRAMCFRMVIRGQP